MLQLVFLIGLLAPCTTQIDLIRQRTILLLVFTQPLTFTSFVKKMLTNFVGTCWKFADALQGGLTCFVRLFYPHRDLIVEHLLALRPRNQCCKSRFPLESYQLPKNMQFQVLRTFRSLTTSRRYFDLKAHYQETPTADASELWLVTPLYPCNVKLIV